MSNDTTCPTCGQTGLSERFARGTGRRYLAHVETYPNGTSYFRAVHDSDRCAAYLTRMAQLIEQGHTLAVKEAWMDFRLAAMEAWNTEARAKMDAGRASGLSPEAMCELHQQVEATRPTPDSLRPAFEAQRAVTV